MTSRIFPVTGGALLFAACMSSTIAAPEDKKAVVDQMSGVLAPDLERGAAAWSPDSAAMPAERTQPAADHTHMLTAAWAPIASLDQLVSFADSVVRGHVVDRHYDVFRSFDNPKEGSPALGADGQPIHSDLAVTIVEYEVDEVISAVPGSRVKAGQRVQTLFAGGLLEDGCVAEPADNPLPKKGEQNVLFLEPLANHQLVANARMTTLFAVAGGVQGRVRVEAGRTQPVAPGVETVDGAGFARFHGRPISETLATIRSAASRRTSTAPDFLFERDPANP